LAEEQPCHPILYLPLLVLGSKILLLAQRIRFLHREVVIPMSLRLVLVQQTRRVVLLVLLKIG
jgi:hypothetical protein